MSAYDVVKDVAVAGRIAIAVLVSTAGIGNFEAQYRQWAEIEARSWVSQGLTEGQIKDRAKSYANSLR